MLNDEKVNSNWLLWKINSPTNEFNFFVLLL